jgi:hypothetical protein
MSSQKLYVFVAEESHNAAIIRKEKIKGQPRYQIIKWDMITNKFTEGQWLLNKQLFIKGCSISPNGELFGWQYNRFWTNEDTHAGISIIPNFTAELYGRGCGRYNTVVFDYNSHPISRPFNFEKKGTLDITLSDVDEKYTKCAPNGLQPQTFNTKYGNIVRVDGYKLIVDDVIVYDAEHNIFINTPKKINK